MLAPSRGLLSPLLETPLLLLVAVLMGILRRERPSEMVPSPMDMVEKSKSKLLKETETLDEFSSFASFLAAVTSGALDGRPLLLFPDRLGERELVVLPLLVLLPLLPLLTRPTSRLE